MKVIRTVVAFAVLCCWFWSPLLAQTRADTTHLRDAVTRLTAIRNAVNNSTGAKTMAAQAMTAESLYFRSKAGSTPPPPPPVNRPPIARISTSCDPTTMICTANGGASTDDQGVVGGSIAWGDGGISPVVTSTHIYHAAGQYTIRLTVRDAAGLTDDTTAIVSFAAAPPPPPPPPPPPDTVVVNDTTQSIAAPAELPKVQVVVAFAKAARTVPVFQGADLQASLNAAQPGDSLVLSGTFTGNYTLPQRPCGAGISVVGTTKPLVQGTRVTPAYAAGFAKIVSPNTQPALRTTQPTCGWRLAGLEITGTLSSVSIQYGLVWLGDGGWLGGGETQTTLTMVPRDLLLSHVYLHGSPALLAQRCLNLNSANTVLRDSWISECTIAGTQGQAIAVWNSPGPLLIENNRIEGAGQNILFGGADPGIPNLIPSDITFRRNHVYKNPAWRGLYTVSFLLETKNIQRALFEDNVFENTWASAQSGMAIGFKSQTGNEQGFNLWQGSTDITFRWNVVRNAQRGLNLQAVGEGGSSRHVARVTATDNLFTGIGTSAGLTPTDGWLVLLTQDLRDINIARNTFVGNTPGYGLDVYFANGGGGQRMDIRSNLFGGQSYYAIGSDNGLHTQALNNFYGSSWRFSGNVLSQVDGQFAALSPPGNIYVDAISKLGLTSDFRSTVYPTVGANITELTRRTAGVVVP